MTDRNDFSSLKNLPPDVLSEVVREGELRLQAQMQQAMASDQRAIAWLTLITGTATVALGAGFGLLLSNRSPFVGLVVLIFAVAMAASALKALDVVRPTTFCFPGNEPRNWLPICWDRGAKRDMKQARFEQARALQNQIAENAKWAKTCADNLRTSMVLAMWAITYGAILVFLYFLWELAKP